MVALLDSFLQLQLLSFFLFVALLAASLQLFGGELQVEQVLLHAVHRHRGQDLQNNFLSQSQDLNSQSAGLRKSVAVFPLSVMTQQDSQAER